MGKTHFPRFCPCSFRVFPGPKTLETLNPEPCSSWWGLRGDQQEVAASGEEQAAYSINLPPMRVASQLMAIQHTPCCCGGHDH